MKWFRILRDRLRALRQRESVINDIDREMRRISNCRWRQTSGPECRRRKHARKRCEVSATLTGPSMPLTT